MSAKFKKGDTAFFVESNCRLFGTKEEAEATLPKKDPPKRKTHWDYMQMVACLFFQRNYSVSSHRYGDLCYSY